MLRHNKAIYALVTTFMFVMVIVFVVLAIIYIGQVIKIKTAEVNDDAVQYENVMDAKNRILSSQCHGSVIDMDKANITCGFPRGFIRGYVIEMTAYPNCTNSTLNWTHIAGDDGDGQVSTYFIAIKSNITQNLCPGRLKVIY